MINLVRNIFPNLEIHASTQFHNHNIEDLKFLKSIGIKRAVLARELSLNKIKELDIDIEKEVFVHGALCICYSGQCLMSSIVMNRSGNRGECAGMCRLPYSLIKENEPINTDGEYLLSPKELCTIRNLKEILESNIDSIKIEGRMKSPEYVGFITRLYRKAIDDYYNNKEIKITENDIEKLKILFNRDFTKGYLLNDNKNITNQFTPNHQGIEIGKVINIINDKIKIKLTNNLNQGDAIRFKNSNKGLYANFIYNENNKLINSAKRNDIIFVDNKIGLKNNNTVLKTIDIKLLEEIKNYPQKKISISINVIAKLDQRIKIEFNDGENIVSEEGDLVVSSINQSLTEEIIKDKISKLGNTIYKVENLTINMDKNIFIPIKNINEIRRTLVEKLNKERSKITTNFIKKEFSLNKTQNNVTKELGILIEREEDYLLLNKKENIVFYTSNLKLYKKYKDNNIYLRLPRVIDNFNEYNNEKLLLNDIGSINKYCSNNIIFSDIYANVMNIYTVKYLTELGVKKIGISPELTNEEIENLYETYLNIFNETPNIEVFAFGKLELMITKHCILKNNINKSIVCHICKDSTKYYLKDRNKEKYRIITNNCNNIILNYKNINNIKSIKNSSIPNIYISLIDITEQEKNIIIKLVEEW